MIVATENLTKKYKGKNVFSNLNLEIKSGQFVTIFGPSGCGKSTILNIIGLLDNKYEGDIFVCNEKNPKINGRIGRQLLRNKIAYIFQNFALIDNKDVVENLMIALEFEKLSKKEKIMKIEAVLTKVGLEDMGQKKIYQLSGGQQQRVAIARTMLKNCEIILADEPTGSLDEETRDDIIKILQSLQSEGKTIIVVSHDPKFKEYSDKIYQL